MDSIPLRGLLKQFCRTLDDSQERSRSDQDLLQAYAAERDHAAFAALVRRHGSLVHGVCRRVLQDHHDAEDAFQATFLVLARKAASIRKQQALASWLYGVAYRLASKLRLKAARRRSHEKQATSPPATDAGELTWNELRGVLDEELSRLPEKFRVPLVLCYLDGKTQDEAARQLDWSLGTFRRRLDSGRELLRERLIRRGLTLSAAMFPALLAQQAVAAVPTPLLTATCEAAVLFGSGQLAGGMAAVPVALAEGFMRAMLLSKISTLAVGLLGLLSLCMLSACIWNNRSTGEPVADRENAAEESAEQRDKPQAERDAAPGNSASFPRRLFAISVNNYVMTNPISFGAGEQTVEKLVHRLADRLSIPADQVVLLCDAAARSETKQPLPALSAAELARLSDEEVKQLLDGPPPAPSPPIKGIIERNIVRFLESSRPQDRIVLLFIGHAVEIDGQGFLVPLEGEPTNKQTLIPLSWVYDRLAECKARQKVFIVDVCRYDPTRGEARGQTPTMSDKLDAQLAKPPDGVQVLTACTAGQYSYELDSKDKAGCQGGIVLNLLPQLQLKDVRQRPEDSIPIAALARSLVPRTRYLARAFLNQEQTPRLSGDESPSELAYDPKMPAAPPFQLDRTAIFAKGMTTRADLESFFREIKGLPAVRPVNDSIAFDQDVLPIFRAKCADCHMDPAKKKGGLDLRTAASTKKGGDGGPGVVPGNLKKSMVWEVVEQNQMPPEGFPPLAAPEKITIQRWITSGAPESRELFAGTALEGSYFGTIPPSPMLRLAPYADDDKDSPLREKVREAIAQLKEPASRQPLREGFIRSFDPNNAQQVNVFKNSIAQLQMDVGLAQFKLDTLLEELESFKKDRDKETKRWQALYDFVRARLAARIAYMYEYNAKLGEMRKEFPPLDPAKHTGWHLVGTETIADRDAQKYAKMAIQFLDTLARDNPGTPWQFLAQREKQIAMGLEWRAR